MRGSFTEIAQFMDLVEPPVSLSRLLDMHQLEAGDGFGEVWRRHNHSEQQEVRFLFWNTFLMDFLRGVTPDSQVARWILGVLTVGGSELARETEELVATWGKAIWSRYSDSPHTRPFKPAVESRSREIGARVSRFSSISALCEVWTNREKDWLLGSWSRRPRSHNSVISERQLRSSGLITVCNDHSSSSGGFHRYEAESGADKIVGKGVMLTHVDLGVGGSMFDVYSTHLNAGDLPVKVMQFIELLSFIERTRVVVNPAVLVGDFNLNAYKETVFTPSDLIAEGGQSSHFWDALRLGGGVGAEEFSDTVLSLSSGLRTFLLNFNGTINELMTGSLTLLGFKDLWASRNDSRNAANRGYGYTTDLLEAGTPDQICPVVAGSEMNICRELLSAPAKATRIDYVFVSDTHPTQSFTIDFSSAERFRADRAADAPDRDEIAFMSDHLGLTSIMLVTPR